MEKKTAIKANGFALLPFILLLVLFLCGFPIVTATLFGCIMTFFYSRKKVSEKFSVFARGVADEGVIIMLVIFALSGAFSSVATAMGGRDSVVNLGLSFVPAQFLVAGCFIIAMLMSTCLLYTSKMAGRKMIMSMAISNSCQFRDFIFTDFLCVQTSILKHTSTFRNSVFLIFFK